MKRFIQVEMSLRRHPKLMRLRVRLQNPLAAWYLVEFWMWCVEYAPDGDISEFSAEEIEAAVGWTLDAGVLFRALRECRFIDDLPDGKMLVHDWMEHQGQWIKKLETDRKRLRKWRKGQTKPLNDETRTETPNETRTKRVRTRSVRDNRTGHNKTEQNKTDQREESGQAALTPADSDREGLTAHDLIAVFCEEWGSAYPGERYQVTPRDAGQAKASRITTGPRWRETVRRYVSSSREFYASARHPLHMLLAAVNEFSGDVRRTPPNGVPRDVRVGHAPAEVKPRPSGEVDL